MCCDGCPSSGINIVREEVLADAASKFGCAMILCFRICLRVNCSVFIVRTNLVVWAVNLQPREFIVTVSSQLVGCSLYGGKCNRSKFVFPYLLHFLVVLLL